MRIRLFAKSCKKFCGFVCLMLLAANLMCESAFAQNRTYTVGEIENLIGGITAWKTEQSGSHSVQQWLNNGLSDEAGTSPADWYMIALRQFNGSYNYSAYSNALSRSVQTISGEKPTDLQRIALAYSAIGGGADFVGETISQSTGKLGIMSNIYGLILMDSGAYVSTQVSRNHIISQILSLQQSGGGWALTGANPDVDVTAMAIQALAPYYDSGDVKSAVDQALALLSQKQQETGDYSSWGKNNAESTAQVITALAALHIDCTTDRRFIKNGNTVLDGLLQYKNSDGSFSHALGEKYNDMASAQAMYSLVALWRQKTGRNFLYKFTDRVIPRNEKSSTASNKSKEISPLNMPSNTESSTQTEKQGLTTTAEDTAPTELQTQESESESPSTQVQAGETSSDSMTGTQSKNSFDRYKIWVYVVIGCGAILVIAYFIFTKKSTVKNIALIVALSAGAMLAVGFAHVQTVDEYYQMHPEDIRPDSKTVSIRIQCDTAADKMPADALPLGVCMLDKTEYVLHEGDTAFDVLNRAVKFNKIPMEYQRNSSGLVYVQGIGGLFEFDCGAMSGWMYRVNGQFQTVGCSDYVLSDGDSLEWIYTCELGKDIGMDVQ